MISFQLDKQFFFKLYFIFFLIIYINIYFYILVENFFIYSFVEIIDNSNYHITFSIFTFFFIISTLLINNYYKKKNSKINITIINFPIEKNIKILIFLNIIGIIFFTLFKLYPILLWQSEKFDDPVKFLDFSCYFIFIKEFILQRDAFIANQNFFFSTLLNNISWIGTVLLNFYYLIIFFVVILMNKISKKYIFISIFLIVISLTIYFLFTGSKMLLLTSLIFIFISLSLSYSLNVISLRKALIILIFCKIFVILAYFSVQQLRTFCFVGSSDYDSNLEFNRIYFIKKQESQNNYINYLRTIINNNVTVNYSLFYILSGKLSGDFLIILDKNKKFDAGKFIYLKQIFNKSVNDLSKLGLKGIDFYEYDSNFIKRHNPIVSLYHMLFRDFAFLNLSILIFIFLLIFLQFLYLRNVTSVFIFIYSFVIFFYSISSIGFVNLLATFNSNIIFFNFMIFLIYFFSRAKIKIKK